VNVARALEDTLGGRWSVHALNASGFCATWQAQGAQSTLFVKSLPSAQAEVLEAEADGLEALAATGTVRVPAVAGCWRDDPSGQALLALEWLELVAPDAGFGARLGRSLGALHRAAPAEGAGRYGWRRDNRIGATPQANRWSDDWIAFYGRRRLAPMRERLASSELGDAVDAVIDALPRFFDDGHVPRARLIHGDLWSGNWAALADGSPAIYDPAVSCADAEAELAMMELFGAPPAGFWPAYRETAGLHAGYARRRGLYQLYHLLNHAVLFGGGYLRQSLELARTLVRR
jgi:fructosamine-3-kinase